MKYRHAIRIFGVTVTLLCGADLFSFSDDTAPVSKPKIQFPPDKPLQPIRAAGSLAIQAIQGTPDGPAIGMVDVTVDLFHEDKLIKTISTQLDEFGIVVLDTISLDKSVIPIINISYASVMYRGVGATMDATHPQQAIKVTCYESTNDPPLWTIPMRQIMLSEAPQGVKVTEILLLMNPSKHTWLGIPQPTNDPSTLSITLPSNAEQVSLGTGFHDWCCTSLQDGVLQNHLPLMPHITELTFSYFVHLESSVFEFDTPANTDQLVVMLPDNLHTKQTKGLLLGGTKLIADTQVRYYTASNLEKGDAVGISLIGLQTLKSENIQTDSRTSKLVTLLITIGGAILFIAIGFIVLKKNSKAD